MSRYNPREIEEKWQKAWQTDRTFVPDLKKAPKPFYNLMMFPYPSGEGLHVGHVYAFGGADTYGHFKKMQGNDVFEPMGFDSFGIHSENYAIKVGKHPQTLIDETTTYFREKQLKRLGALFDWEHEVTTSDPDYYRWTQWLFIQLFKAGLAVRKEAPVDWCPSCLTVLADEQVIGGKCERCGTEVVQKHLAQWFFKITNFAEKLLTNLDKIDWSATTKQMQRNWIGKSHGAEINFPVKGSEEVIKVFTTRPDTIFGATFMVIAAEHPLVTKIESKEVQDYVNKAKNKSEVDREKEKTGVFTGLYALNPITNKEIPVWIADYVLMGYGTGAIMAVPAHDQRDYEFAKNYDYQ
jgi:leucyl-tRNA synthetase